jgi:hypothetical protein
MDSDTYRRNHYDVTNAVYVADPRAVHAEVSRILGRLYPEADLAVLERAFDTFARLYTGELEGYVGCETWYHDAQHSLDCTLVMARLIDGYERSSADDGLLGPRRAVLALIAALFHDAGYVRHVDDSEAHGAEFTLYHVQRSGNFLVELLPALGYSSEAAMTEQLVHFTGYEIALDRIDVQAPRDRRLGFLLGTADILAQMADRCYLEKCRDCLYPEFEVCGLAGEPKPGGPTPVYASPSDLIKRTPGFMDQLWSDRMEAYFQGSYHYIARHFGGANPYLGMIQNHRARLDHALASDAIVDGLRRRVECINAGPLRVILRGQTNDATVRAQSRPPTPGDLRRSVGAVADTSDTA